MENLAAFRSPSGPGRHGGGPVRVGAAHPLHRAEVLARLKQFIPSYVKGASGSFAITKANLGIASQRARSLAALSNAFDATEPSTDIVELVELLIALGK